MSRENIHHKIYLFGLLVVIIGLPSSVFLMSIGQIILLANWILEFNFKKRIPRFWNNKSAVTYISIFLICFLGFIHTDDLFSGYKAMRLMLPVLLLPVIVSSSRLNKKEFHFIMGIFVATVIFITILGVFAYYGFLLEKVTNIRLLSLFVSHIRLSLMMVTSITMLIYFLVRATEIRYKLMLLIPIIWLLYFVIFIESFTGVLVIIVSIGVIPLYFIITDKNKIRKYISVLLLILFPIGGAYFITSEFSHLKHKRDINWDKFDKTTLNGNAYYHNKKVTTFENNHFVGSYICSKELIKAWNKRSDQKIEAKPGDGLGIRAILARYLTSKGLRKDSLGVSKLSEQDIINIENGITNYLYPERRGMAFRWYDAKWQFQVYLNGGNPSGHSLTQRLEYWRNAYHLFRSNLLFGVGVGDAEAAIVKQYDIDQSAMTNQWRLLAHNQYLTIGIQVGLFGLIAVLSCIFLLFRAGLRKKAFLFLFFLTSMCVSMLFEDTLVTQAGCTLFGCIGSFLLLSTEDPV